jgi:hypothetical protein
MGEGDRNSLLDSGPLERYQIKFLIHNGLPELTPLTLNFRLLAVHFGFGTIQHTPDKLSRIQEALDWFSSGTAKRTLAVLLGCTNHWTLYCLYANDRNEVSRYYFDSKNNRVLDTLDTDMLVAEENEERAWRGVEPLNPFYASLRYQYSTDIHSMLHLLDGALFNGESLIAYWVKREMD